MKLPLLLSGLVLLSSALTAPRAVAGPALPYLTYDPNNRECFVFTAGDEHVSYSLKEPKRWLQFPMSGFNPKIKTPQGSCDFSNGYYNSCCAQLGMRLLSDEEIKERVVLVTDHRPKVVPPPPPSPTASPSASPTETPAPTLRPTTPPAFIVQKEDNPGSRWERERRTRLLIFIAMAVILTVLVALGLRALMRHSKRKQIALQLALFAVANLGGFIGGVEAGKRVFNAVSSSFRNHDTAGPVLIAAIPGLAALIGGWALTAAAIHGILWLLFAPFLKPRK